MTKSMQLLVVTLLFISLSWPVTAVSASSHDVIPTPLMNSKKLELDHLPADTITPQRLERKSPIPMALRQNARCTFMETGTASLYYEEQGQGEPIILLQADGLDRRVWDDQFDVLAQYYRVVRFDARNHGLTRCSADTFCHLADLCCLIRHLGIDKATLVGVSKGAGMAIDFALARPERVAGLVLISPNLSDYPVTDPQVIDCQRRLQEAGTRPETVEYLLKTWADGPFRKPHETGAAIRNRLKEIYASTLFNRVVRGHEKMQKIETLDRLADIRVPALIIVGDLDRPCVQAMSNKLTRDMVDVRIEVIRDAAHWVHMEKPVEVNRIMLDYLTQIIPWRLAPQKTESEMMVLGGIITFTN